MAESRIILNEREARVARAALARMQAFLATEAEIGRARLGLCVDVLNQHRKAVSGASRELSDALTSYDRLKAGEVAEVFEQWRHDPGVSLIIARIALGMSQADLAERLGLKEQQIQRYEAERYRSISLANFRRIGAAVGVRLTTELYDSGSSWAARASVSGLKYTEDQLKRVLRHAKEHEWLDPPRGEEEQALLDYIGDTAARFGSPSLLRTGLNPQDLHQDLALVAWRTRVISKADPLIAEGSASFDPLDVYWVCDLVRLSARDDGPLAAVEFLAERGVVVIAEQQVPGLSLDGAALMVRGTPVVGLTLRHDRLDNFWFTLLHELGHVFLHHRSGLSVGFYDDTEGAPEDELELEANQFASSALIPPERWRSSAARISKSPEPIEALAAQIGIHPAIAFGRVRRERQDYRLFSNRVGYGEVRKWFKQSS